MNNLGVKSLPSPMRVVGVAAFVFLCILGGSAAHPSPGLAEEGPDRETEATVATTVLEPGWNLAGWLGPTVPASDLFGAIPALKVLHTWDSRGQRYQTGTRTSGPPGGLPDLETGMGLWLYISGDESFEWKRPITPQGVVVPLREGWNLVAWSGLDGLPATTALNRFGDLLVEALRWDEEAGRYERWRPDMPPAGTPGKALNDLPVGDALWIKLTRDRDWWVPGSRQPTFAFHHTFTAALRDQARTQVSDVIAFFAERLGASFPEVKVLPPGAGWCYAGGDSIWLGHPWCAAHEYFHVLQYQAALGTPSGPGWLLEGAATYMEELYEGDLEFRRRIAPSRAAQVGSLRNLGMADEVALSYHLGFLAADWLVQHAGERSLIEFYRQLPVHDGWEDAFAETFALTVEEFYEAFALYRAIVAPPLPHAVDGAVRSLVAAEGAIEQDHVERIQAEMDRVSELLVERFGAEPAEYSVYIGTDLNDVADHRDRLWQNPWWDYEVRQLTLPLEWYWPCSFGATGWIVKVLDCGRPLGPEAYVNAHMRVLLEGKAQLDPSPLWIEAGTGMLAVLASRLGKAAGYASGHAAEPTSCGDAGAGPQGGLRNLESRGDWEAGDIKEHREASLAGAIWLARHAGERSLFRYFALLPGDPFGEPSERSWRDAFEEAFGLAIDDFYAKFEACHTPALGGPAPELTTLVTGDPGVVIMEWSEGPATATRWQFRLRAAQAWSGWTDIPDEDANARRYRVANLPGGSWWFFQVRGVVGTLAGEPSASAEGRVPAFDANGIPWLDAGWGYEPQLSEGGRAWRLDRTVVDIPAGMRISAWADYPLVDPRPPFEVATIEDADSGSILRLSTDFGAECARVIQPSPSGRDVNALFDRIVASARVQVGAPPWLGVAATGERGEVRLRWVGGPWNATHWEYRLRGPYPCQAGSGCDASQRAHLSWGEWTKISSGAEAGSHLVSGLPDVAAWDFQVRAVTGGVAGTESMLWNFGAPAVVGPDGIPQLHRFYDGEGGRTWRLGASLTVIEVPTDLVVGVSDHYSDGAFGVSDAESGDWILVDAETAREVEFEGGLVGNKPPCGPASERNRALFDQMRASVRLQPIVWE